jgi:hypothetical protein
MCCVVRSTTHFWGPSQMVIQNGEMTGGGKIEKYEEKSGV